MDTTIISHIRQSDGAIQSNEEHQLGVAQRAKSFAMNFNCGDIAYVVGLLHDKGKEQVQWQKYIRGIISNGPNHAYVGACIARKQYPQLASLIAQPIAGHHRGLYDYFDFIEETNHDIPDDVSLDEPFPCSFPKISNFERRDLHHFVRMLFSCLVDADSLDTEAFVNPEQAQFRGCRSTMKEL